MNKQQDEVFSPGQEDVAPETGSLLAASRRPRARSNRDLIVLMVFALAVTLVAAQFDALESLVEWAGRYEIYEVDEVLTLLIALGFGFGLFSYRRMRELDVEIGLRDQAEIAIRHMALHDPLTGLANRTLYDMRLRQEISRSGRDGIPLAVFGIDIDNFKNVNDAFGHAAGDRLLVTIAARLRDQLRPMDTVARLGGDEFAVIQPGVTGDQGPSALAERVLEAINEPIELDSHQVVVGASIGIVLSKPDLLEPEALVRAADIALYRAKREARSSFRFFDTEMDHELAERRALERDLRAAVATGALELVYQPLFEVDPKRLSGFEALLRWNHESRGPIPPGRFLPLAEESGLILQIGDWVLRTACAQALCWPDAIRVTVNVSAVQFKHNDLPERIAAVLAETGLRPERLELEITESILVQDSGANLDSLRRLRARGVRIAMADFGTGFSSLSYLRRFPFDRIKIDRSFVAHMARNREEAAFVRAVVALGHNLGMTTSAEGIESTDQLAALVEQGCEEGQGFLLGRPIRAEETETWCRLEAAAPSPAGSAAGPIRSPRRQ